MFSTTNKVKFQDQQLDDYMLENSVLKSKLQSKIDALCIMSRELDKCSMERDRYKVLVEQIKYKNKIQYHGEDITNHVGRFIPTNTVSGSDLLAKTRDHNSLLKLEVESLRSKLDDAMGDNIALRKQLHRKSSVCEQENDIHHLTTQSCSNQDFEKLVQEIEKLQKKYQQVQLDHRATLDEKEELVNDRDYYKNKVQRLNQQISYILSNRVTSKIENETDLPKPMIDIDGLVTENKYLNERITQLQVEKEIIKRTLTKYKTLLENRKNDPLYIKKGFADVMTQKQVREFLESNTKTNLKRTSIVELKSLCLGLFEALNDKSIALQHQRKTNQILGNRITELEKALENWCNGKNCVPIFPTQMLLDELLPDIGSPKSDESQDKSSNGEDDQRSYVENDKIISIENSENAIKNSNIDYEENDAEENGTTKTVLPFELEELVKEALAELKPNAFET